MSLSDELTIARKRAVPLITIGTPDPGETIKNCMVSLNGDTENVAVIVWDIINGPRALTKPALEWLNASCLVDDPYNPGRKKVENPKIAMGNPIEFLSKIATGAPKRGVFIVHNAHRIFLEVPTPALQAVWNLRDVLKTIPACLVMLGPLGWKTPPELANDIIAMKDPLPDKDRVRSIVENISLKAKLSLSDDDISNAVAAVNGISAFGVEQSVAMAINSDSLDRDSLWKRAVAMIESTSGMTVHRGGESFSRFGGYSNVVDFIKKIMSGPKRPNGIFFIDEIEKMFAGTRGDTSGVSQSLDSMFLSWTQKLRAPGVIFYGPAGSGKSECGKCAGNFGGVPTMVVSASGIKGSLVGESEQRFGAVLETAESVASGNILMIATCNSMDSLSPEQRRRFRFGTFFFDLPDDEEREAIWDVFVDRYPDVDFTLKPYDNGWTGAEIASCIDIASLLGISLVEASSYIVPISVQNADKINQMRADADKRYISASRPGLYRYTPQQTLSVIAERSMAV